MKHNKIITISSIFIIVIAIVLFLLISNSAIFKASELYSENEIQRAEEIVKQKFEDFDGCILISVSYAGDDISLKEADRRDYENVIVIKSVFISPLKSKGSWEPHSLYIWQFILGSNSEKNWQILDYGEV